MGTYTLTIGGLLALAIQFVLPLIVGLVTKASTSAGVKAVLLLFLSAVTQVLVAWSEAVAAGHPMSWTTVLWSSLVGFVIAVAVHFGLWKPTGASDGAQAIGPSDRRTISAR